MRQWPSTCQRALSTGLPSDCIPKVQIFMSSSLCLTSLWQLPQASTIPVATSIQLDRPPSRGGDETSSGCNVAPPGGLQRSKRTATAPVSKERHLAGTAVELRRWQRVWRPFGELVAMAAIVKGPWCKGVAVAVAVAIVVINSSNT